MREGGREKARDTGSKRVRERERPRKDEVEGAIGHRKGILQILK